MAKVRKRRTLKSTLASLEKNGVRMNRVWAMPNSHTFSIKPINELIKKYIRGKSIDPFANNSKLSRITNDLDPEFDTDYNLDALEFLAKFKKNEIDTVLYDPPYSVRQVSECYRKLELTVNMQTTQANFWTRFKKEISRVTKSGGIVISCGWNSGGIGKNLGFKIIEILLVPHGGPHHDTIIVVEIKA